MYFVDKEHKDNFDKLLSSVFSHFREDREYLPTIYLAAIPDIFKCLDINELSVHYTPLLQLTEYREEDGKLVVRHQRLTSSTKLIVEFGLSLFNGFPVELSEVFGFVTRDDWYYALLESIRIRENK